MRKSSQLLASIFVLVCSFQISFAQVTADFSSNTSSGCGSLQVTFSDLSTSTAGSIISWDWDLGGVSSTVKNPGRIFGTPDCYEICLTVTDSEGNTATECKPCFIQVFHLPEVAFAADPPVGCSPLEVSFTSQSTSEDGDIVQAIWGIGGSAGVIVDDGSLPDVTSTYTVPDNYNISLTVTDDNGCSNTANANDFVIVSPDPIADFSAPTTFSCTSPFIVDFQNNQPLNPDVSCFWNFGNGLTFLGHDPPPTVYPTFGSYDVILICTNTVTGCADTLTRPAYIQVGHPIEFESSVDSGCEDLIVSFTDLSLDIANGGVVWDFGDGNTSTDANPNHTYVDPGCYTITLTRTVNGCTAFATSPACIEVFPLPTPSYTNDAPIGCTAPHTVQFFGASDTPNVTWHWNFGDGSPTSSEQNPTHTYTSFGIFNYTLTIRDENNCARTINTGEIIVQTINANMPVDTIEGCTPLTVDLVNTSTSPTPITSYEWTVTNFSTSPPSSFTDNAENPQFILVDTGYYETMLIVENDLGCIDTSFFYKQIAVGQPPEMAFSADPVVSCVETPITFADGTSDNTNDWLWEFGDGGFGYGAFPEHEYIDTGYFDVTLYAYHHSCENKLTIDSFVYVQPPIAQFTVVQDCEIPFEISLIDASIGADSVIYDFGIDGVEWDTTTVREPVFTYPETGDYTITMTVFNVETGCEDDVTRFVRIRDVQSAFTVDSPLTGCVPMTMEFTDNSQDAENYSWSASGGNFSNASNENASVSFVTPGTYSDIQLIVTDVNGCQDTSIFTETIFANGVDADFAIDPSTGCRPLTVDFNDLSSSTFGNLTDWSWEFSEGDPLVTEQNPTNVFENIGTYNIIITVEDDWGCVGQKAIPNGVEVTYPLVSFEADTLSCTTREVSFSNTSTGHTLSYHWDFGDGQFSSASTPTHLYQNEGVYDVCLTATDINGCDSTFCRTDYVVIANPVAALEGDSTHATCPPLIVNFDNQSTDANQFIWDFGDNSGTSNLDNPPHVYSEPGSFDLTLIASFDGFCADTLLIEDYIMVEGPVGNFSFDIDSACVPAVITFYGESIDFYNYTWDFGDGSLDTALNVMTDTIQYVYENTGKYVPKLILEDFNQCARAFESPDTIYLERLDLDFIATDSVLCSGEDNTTFINLTNSSLPLNSVEWILPGGNPESSTLIEPTVNYENAGVFDVTLISDNGFCIDTLIQPAAIKVGETPVAAFMMNDTMDCAPFPVNFTDLSTVGTGFIAGWQWEYDDGESSNFQNPTHVFDETGPFNVSLEVTTDIGCTDNVTNLIEVFLVPEVETPEPYNICIGNTVTLEVEIVSDPTGITYFWLDDPSLSCTDCLSPEANPIDTTVYYFVVNSAIGCADTSEVMVEVRPFPAPIVSITEDTTICANSVIQIIADGGTNVYEYQWDQTALGLSCYENCLNPIATPETSTLYTVSVTNEFACQTIEDVLVEVIDEYQPFAGPDRTICEGESTQLDASFGNDPTWMVTEGLSCAYCPDPIANPDFTTTYLVNVTTDMGCKVTDTLVINVRNEADVDAGVDDVVCLGESIQLDAIGFGQISWTPDASLDNSAILDPMASPNTPTTYILTVSEDECVLTDTVRIDVATQAEVFAESQTICLGDSIELMAYGTANEFSWSPATGLSDSTIANPMARPIETTTYTVTGKLGTCQDGSAEVTVSVIPGPVTSLAPNYDFFPGQTVELEVTTEDVAAFTYEWSPIDLVSCVSCNNPQVTVDSSTQFMVLVTDPVTGCWTQDTTLARLRNNCPEDLIGVPNIFTPNNDGKNDVLTLHLSPAIQSTGIDVFRIYDRWGAQIFESKDAADGWDGMYKGKPMSAGVYIYYIEAQCPVGEGKIMKKGDITLLK